MFDLKNKTALVTGAASGIGAAIAQAFARSGAFVDFADREVEGAGGGAAKLRAEGGKTEVVEMDVAPRHFFPIRNSLLFRFKIQKSTNNDLALKSRV
jgi:NAD(P)-dependent dehydrogenase (short-subunit alcohol dehydrogenase family)